jgi:hypothetical protein
VLDPVDLIGKPQVELEADPFRLVEATALDQVDSPVRQSFELGEFEVEMVEFRVDV